MLPIEVKAGENLRSKSLRVACDKFNLDTALRTSLSPYRNDGWLTNVPLWAIGQFEGLLGWLRRTTESEDIVQVLPVESRTAQTITSSGHSLEVSCSAWFL